MCSSASQQPLVCSSLWIIKALVCSNGTFSSPLKQQATKAFTFWVAFEQQRLWHTVSTKRCRCRWQRVEVLLCYLVLLVLTELSWSSRTSYTVAGPSWFLSTSSLWCSVFPVHEPGGHPPKALCFLMFRSPEFKLPFGQLCGLSNYPPEGFDHLCTPSVVSWRAFASVCAPWSLFTLAWHLVKCGFIILLRNFIT